VFHVQVRESQEGRQRLLVPPMLGCFCIEQYLIKSVVVVSACRVINLSATFMSAAM